MSLKTHLEVDRSPGQVCVKTEATFHGRAPSWRLRRRRGCGGGCSSGRRRSWGWGGAACARVSSSRTCSPPSRWRRSSGRCGTTPQVTPRSRQPATSPPHPRSELRGLGLLSLFRGQVRPPALLHLAGQEQVRQHGPGAVTRCGNTESPLVPQKVPSEGS